MHAVHRITTGKTLIHIKQKQVNIQPSVVAHMFKTQHSRSRGRLFSLTIGQPRLYRETIFQTNNGKIIVIIIIMYNDKNREDTHNQSLAYMCIHIYSPKKHNTSVPQISKYAHICSPKNPSNPPKIPSINELPMTKTVSLRFTTASTHLFFFRYTFAIPQ